MRIFLHELFHIMMDFADKVFIGSYDGFPSEGPMLKGSDSAALRVNSKLQLPVAF